MKMYKHSKYKSKNPKKPNNYAIFNKNFVWNKGTDEEKIYPTIEMIYVQPTSRNEGIGRCLVQSVLEYMEKEKINYCVFDNYANYFWETSSNKKIY